MDSFHAWTCDVGIVDDVGIADVLLMKGHIEYDDAEWGWFSEAQLVASIVTTDHRFASIHVGVCDKFMHVQLQLGTQLPTLLSSFRSTMDVLDGAWNEWQFDWDAGARTVRLTCDMVTCVHRFHPGRLRELSFPWMRKARDSLPYEYVEFLAWYGKPS